MKSFIPRFGALLLLISSVLVIPATAPAADAATQPEPPKEERQLKPVKKILFLGDSMTGWLAEALNAYGKVNGFEVSTIVWDGSTISKWASSGKLPSLINKYDPDAVFVSLGMNELFEAHPGTRLATPVSTIKDAVGDKPLVWVGPPSWPGQKKGQVLNDWLQRTLGSDVFFRSFDLTLPRQGARNPHPTRQGMIQWTDSLVNWLKDNKSLKFTTLDRPEKTRMVRGTTFVYKRMGESL